MYSYVQNLQQNNTGEKHTRTRAYELFLLRARCKKRANTVLPIHRRFQNGRRRIRGGVDVGFFL